ncbi:MAG TPA: nucleotidyltransferase family protein [Pseudoneobacillus sp.]|nr:nucleotidyltransferase family protein [Pseudoneobacillus sp.]
MTNFEGYLIVLNETDIIFLISEDRYMMEILKAAKSLNLPDWWICAGFVRSKIWDTLHEKRERTPIPDIDVIYFDPSNIDEKEEKKLEEKLKLLLPNIPWSVKNEARMHLKNNITPYCSSVDAISKFPETATALGVKLDHNDNILLTAPCGIDDVIQLKVKPTPYFLEDHKRLDIYKKRLLKKDWKSSWNKLSFHYL